MLTKLRQIKNRSLKSSTAPLLSGLLSGQRWLEGDRHRANQVMLLGYHQIAADIAHAERAAIPGMAISTHTFRRQMEFVRERYEVLSLAEAGAVLRGEADTARPAVVLTFDDGYRSVYDQAWPVLRELGLTATVFLNPGYIGANQLLDHDLLYRFARQAKLLGLSLRVPLVKAGFNLREVVEITAEVDTQQLCERLIYQPLARRQAILHQLRLFLGEPEPAELSDFGLLDWTQIRALAAGGLSFGAHTVNHPVLTLETPETVDYEIAEARHSLETQLGMPITHFAYPNGSYSPAVKAAVQRLGFDLAVTTEKRINRRGGDLLALGRTCLCEESTRGLTGHYSEAVARLRLAV
ncbi:MAG: polysaccharide deacetylase family protein [Acidobacteria bacterium]|nr:polysaccharide deacetylase family protein [Acidobacteriota bacterium]MBI3422577.1 polysaccharide deacetylase family protein [Acidobacteriota bacterium]